MAARILVMNHAPELLDLYREVLSEEGYEVILSSIAIQDMDEILRIGPDLIILDFMFGNGSPGWIIVQMLKLKPETASIPLIVCTAAVREVREIDSFLVARGIQVVFKPFGLEDLLNAIERALTLPHDALLLHPGNRHSDEDLERRDEEEKDAQ